MKYVLTVTFILWGSAGFSQPCFVHYKAKRDDPLKLHYGVIQIDDEPCDQTDPLNATATSRLAGSNWTLLNVIKSEPTPPTNEEIANAGEFYLKY